jgi:lia operon protein LiaF
VIGGVAGGFAEYVDADPTLVRLAFVVLAFITGGAMILVYLGAWIVMPEGEAAPESAPAAGGGGSGLGHGLFWGAVLILLGGLLLLRQLDIDQPPWEAFLAGALIAVGLLLLIESRRGLHGGLTVLAVILTVLLGLSTLMNVTVHGAFGEQTVRVQQINNLDSNYGHAFGSMTLDLDELEFPEGVTELTASIVFGNLTVDLPDDVGVRANATSIFGRTQIGTEDQAGFSPDWEYQSPNYDDATRRVHLDVSTLFGSAQVNGGR